MASGVGRAEASMAAAQEQFGVSLPALPSKINDWNDVRDLSGHLRAVRERFEKATKKPE